jgi:Golgi nucleoside diphosphatase
MIPTKTLRERMTESLRAAFDSMDVHSTEEFDTDQEALEATLVPLVQAAIQAIGDSCLIKTADSLEPTFTLRAQDLSADILVTTWANMALARNNAARTPKIDEADLCAEAMRAWPARKWPD